MGYYSQVTIAMSQDSYKDLSKRFNNKFENKISDLLQIKKRNDDVILYGDYIKWHVEYDEVEFIVEYLNKLKGYDYHYIVIGDDVDDITYKGGYKADSFDIQLIREVKIKRR